MGRAGCVRCKDAGSLDSSAIGATEDAAACVHSAFQRPVLVLAEVPLARSFRCFKEDRELAQPLVAERFELRHRRTGMDARRALEECPIWKSMPRSRDPTVGEIGRAEVRAAGAVVRVTRGAAGAGRRASRPAWPQAGRFSSLTQLGTFWTISSASASSPVAHGASGRRRTDREPPSPRRTKGKS